MPLHMTNIAYQAKMYQSWTISCPHTWFLTNSHSPCPADKDLPPLVPVDLPVSVFVSVFIFALFIVFVFVLIFVSAFAIVCVCRVSADLTSVFCRQDLVLTILGKTPTQLDKTWQYWEYPLKTSWKLLRINPQNKLTILGSTENNSPTQLANT